jgi:hypothetical protein
LTRELAPNGLKPAAETIARKLFEMNLEAYRAEYPFAHPEGRFYFPPTSPETWKRVSAIQIIKAAEAFRYQCCGLKAFVGSDVDVIIQKVIDKAIKSLPGYSEANWGWV